MKSETIRKKFLDFFEKKGHTVIASGSLIPDDPTSLFTSAGMQQLVPYLSGEKDVIKEFGNRHLVSVQKCFRTGDIDEVGDDTHNTFFEMLGNWSVGGDYFKQGAIELALDFFCNELKLDKDKMWITIFKGEQGIPRDKKAYSLWIKNGIPKERIKEFGIKDNFWGPVTANGPCGPCSEIHYDRGGGCDSCEPNCTKCQRFVEIWNLVFMEYDKQDGKYNKLGQKNIDTGVGFERLVALMNNKDSAFDTDLFDFGVENRTLADHLRAVCFLVTEGILPSNLDRGYVLRRLIRKMYRIKKNDWEAEPVKWIINKYSKIYPELSGKENDILTVIQKEKEKFEQSLSQGMKHFEKIATNDITGEQAFFLFETYGFPLEMIEELAKKKGISVDKYGFEDSFKKHQEISRAGAQKKFGGIGIDKIENKEDRDRAVRLHTATHLLHQALRKVLGDSVQQMGSDINPDRLRFDFSFDRKMSPEEIKKVQDMVNSKIKQDLEVKKQEMSLDDALKSGALAFFKEKYPDKVFVYSIGEFSKEICGGPHVARASEIKEFKIKKEESSSRGVRRIKAVVG